MIYILLSPVLAYIFMWLVWVFYLATVNYEKKEIPVVFKPFHYMLIYVGTGLNWSFNTTIGSLLFLEIPKELYFTNRISRHRFQSEGWRRSLAKVFCRLVNPFDDKGSHCKP